FNQRRIKCCHAGNICHIRKAKRNPDGLILSTELARDWYENTHLYRFERVSEREVLRINLVEDKEEIFSDKTEQSIDVPLFIARRKMKWDHYLFGEVGREIWYGGKKNFSEDKIDLIWNAIETKTQLREVNYRLWPAGIQELKSHLFIVTNNFTDVQAEEFVRPELEE